MSARGARRRLVLLSLVFASGIAAAADPSIEQLSARIDRDRLIVSFRVADGLSEDALERMHSGMTVAFSHRIELLSRRAIPLWPSRVVLRARIETRVAYDALTRRYELFRELRVSGGGKDAPPTRQESRVTASEAEMRAWMTEFDELAIFDPERPLAGRRLRVRVVSSLGRRYVMSIFPAERKVSAELRLDR